MFDFDVTAIAYGGTATVNGLEFIPEVPETYNVFSKINSTAELSIPLDLVSGDFNGKKPYFTIIFDTDDIEVPDFLGDHGLSCEIVQGGDRVSADC
jgi:hypothetical protein